MIDHSDLTVTLNRVVEYSVKNTRGQVYFQADIKGNFWKIVKLLDGGNYTRLVKLASGDYAWDVDVPINVFGEFVNSQCIDGCINHYNTFLNQSKKKFNYCGIDIHLPSWVNYIAIDKDGAIWCYESEPYQYCASINGNFASSPGLKQRPLLSLIKEDSLLESNWKHSVVKI